MTAVAAAGSVVTAIALGVRATMGLFTEAIDAVVLRSR